MSFSNATSFAAVDVPSVDASGAEVLVAIVKGTFQVDDQGRVFRADAQAPVRLSDVPYDDERPAGSIRYPSDVCTAKVGTDVVLVGEAISSKAVTDVDVGVKVRDLSVPIRVHGERLYFRNAMDIVISEGARFERQPIVYEKAFGGVSADQSVVEMRNPVGVGIAKRDADLIDRPAPQIEHPAFPYRSPRDRHPPVGFGAIAPHWSPRRELAGTFDEAWKAGRMPLSPRDFNVRHNNVAHPSLLLAEPLRADDPVGVIAMTPRGFLGFAIPPFRIVLRARFDNLGVQEVRPAIDTLLIEPSKAQFQLVVRGTFPLGRGRNVLRELVADHDG